MLFKACPRCKGDLSVNRDLYGNYKECLQCGYMVDIKGPGHGYRALILKANKKKAA